MNLPNKLTTMRMALVPVFIVLYLMDYHYTAAAVFIAASLTDFLDGHLARKHNLVTNFGKIMDPLADKLLVTSALVCMVQTGVVPGWMVIVMPGQRICHHRSPVCSRQRGSSHRRRMVR